MLTPDHLGSTDAEYYPVFLRSFASGRPPMVDLYHQIGGQYVLYCEAHAVFSDNARWRLLDNNVRRLFVRFRDGELRAGDLGLEDVMSLPDDRVSPYLKARLLYYAIAANSTTAVTAPITSGSIAAARQTTDTVVDYLVRNPRALIPVIKLMRHDPSLVTHSSNVCIYAVGLGQLVGIGSDALANLSLGAFLHDLGMVRVPPGIVGKPGPLTPDEWAIMHQHPKWGVEILSDDIRGQSTVRTIIYQHHERLDGSGYPLKIGKADIHLMARIVGLVDKYDALTSDRPYRPRMQPFGALREIQEDMASQFDRDLFVPLLTMLGPGQG